MRGESPDVYVYDEIPQKLRVQIIHIIQDTIGISNPKSAYVYDYIHKVLCKEYGFFSLTENIINPNAYDRSYQKIKNYFLACDDYERCLDIIEQCFIAIKFIATNYSYYESKINATQKPADAVNELNLRFKESGVGYQFEADEIIRIDSEYIHAELVKPVLYLLGSVPAYRGANDEFLSAHKHYRNKRYKECLNDCLKSFESLMKAIHDKRSWPYEKNYSAKKLIESCLANKLVPIYLKDQTSTLTTLLKSGIPTIRNKESGHGQGADISDVSEHLASYALHLTATNLLFLAKCEATYRC